MRSRFRLDLGPQGRPHVANHPYDTFIPTRLETSSRTLLQDGDYAKYWATLNTKSSFIDSIDPIVNPRYRYRNCNHMKWTGGLNRFSTNYSCSPPWPSTYGYVDISISPYLETLPSVSYEWDSAVKTLADQVAREIQTDFLGFVFLAEARKSIQMIRNPLSLFSPRKRRALASLGEKTFAACQKAGNTLLEFRYGWRPLYQDVCDFSKLLASYGIQNLTRDRELLVEQFSATANGSFASSPPQFLYPTGAMASSWASVCSSSNPWTWRVGNHGAHVRQRLVETKAKGRITCERISIARKPIDHLQNLLDVLHVGNWRQVRDTIWELLPYSFVVDWVVNLDSLWRPEADLELGKENICNLGFSTKCTLKYANEYVAISPVWWMNATPGWIGIPHSAVVGGVLGPQPAQNPGTVSRYTRTVGLPPNGSSVFTSKGISMINGLTGVSLALQRLMLAYKR